MASLRYDPDIDSVEEEKEPLNIVLRRDAQGYSNIPEYY